MIRPVYQLKIFTSSKMTLVFSSMDLCVLGQEAVECMGVGSIGIISATNSEEVSFWFFYYYSS